MAIQHEKGAKRSLAHDLTQVAKDQKRDREYLLYLMLHDPRMQGFFDSKNTLATDLKEVFNETVSLHSYSNDPWSVKQHFMDRAKPLLEAAMEQLEKNDGIISRVFDINGK